MSKIPGAGGIPSKSSYHQHQELVREICLKCQEEFKNIRWYPIHVGLFRNVRGTPIMIGKKGWPDLFAFLPSAGLLTVIAVEVKTGNSVLSKDQKNFKKMFEGFDGLYITARSAQQVINEIRDFYNEKAPTSGALKASSMIQGD